MAVWKELFKGWPRIRLLGHEVHIITSTYGAQQRLTEKEVNDVHIHRVKARRLHYPDLTIPRIMPVEVLKKADIVHVHSHNSLFSMKMLNGLTLMVSAKYSLWLRLH